MLKLITSIIFFSSLCCFSQNNKNVIIDFEIIHLNKKIKLSKFNNSRSISSFRFYISNIQLLENGKKVWEEINSHHLIDASDSSTLTIMLKNIPKNTSYSVVKFNLGIDSTTNVSGALGGDLDPTKGMYWSWQSGYINFKIEGNDSICPNKNNSFQFHIGGYASPYNSLQKIYLKTNNTNKVKILVNLDVFLNNIDLTMEYNVMSPNKKSVKLAKLASKMFSVNEE